ncbi:MAG: DUF1294 domain-containing protein [Acidobacteriota bacterium]
MLSALLVLPMWLALRLMAFFNRSFAATEVMLAAAILVVPSLVAFGLIARDKRLATKGRRRIPESTLHGVELVGGWPGSFLAQRHFRHKTIKRSYRLKFWLIILFYQLVSAVWLFGGLAWRAGIGG